MPHQCTDCGRQFDDGSKEMLSGCPSCGGNKFQFLPGSGTHPGQPSDHDERPDGTESFEETTSTRVEHSVARKVGNAATAVRDLVGSSSSQQADSIGTEPVSEYEPADPTTVQSTRAEAEKPQSPTAGGVADRTDRNSSPREQRDADRLASRGVEERTERPAENAAQASARSEVVSREDLPDTSTTPSQTPWPSERKPAPGTSRQEATRTEKPEEQAPPERPDLSELRDELNQQFESIKVLEPGQYELNLMELFDREEYIVALQEDGKYTVQVPESFQK